MVEWWKNGKTKFWNTGIMEFWNKGKTKNRIDIGRRSAKAKEDSWRRLRLCHAKGDRRQKTELKKGMME